MKEQVEKVENLIKQEPSSSDDEKLPEVCIVKATGPSYEGGDKSKAKKPDSSQVPFGSVF